MLKKNVLFLLILFLSGSIVVSAKNCRIKNNINREWCFYLGEPSGSPEMPEYNDKNWERIGLPHSFSIPYFRSPDFYVGYGWYRKNLEIAEAWKNRRFELQFDGAFQVAEVFVNGKKAGEHSGGYTGFVVDITNFVKIGNNQLAVRVNNLWNPALAPRAGEHVFSGGIYRDVYLTITDPLHIPWNGVAITTPDVSYKSARVALKIEVKNDGKADRQSEICSVIKNNRGKKIAEIKTNCLVKSGELQTIEQQSAPILYPALWSPENPEMYSVETTITTNGKEIDHVINPLGFRTFEWSAENGFSLNGKHYYLRGVNVHQDLAGWGDAMTKADVRRDIQLMKDAGFNFIRGSHYPHHPYFAEVCNELGMLFISENCMWGIGGFKTDGYWDSSTYPIHEKDEAGYEASVRKSLKEMILTNRNNPSILAWSMSNEPFFTAKHTHEKMQKLLSQLVVDSKTLDPSRQTMIGGAQRGSIDRLGDIAGYNGDGAVLFIKPGIPSIVSEYGSCVADRPGDYIPCWGEVGNGAEPEWRAGHAIWCGFDHGSIAGNMGKMGVVDFFRIPKRSWYWYRNQLRNIAPPIWPEEGIPARLKLSADKTVIHGTDASDNVLLMVTILDKEGKHISNSPTVTLTIESGPGEFPTGRSITFHETTADDIRILDGQAAIAFRSYEGGRSVIKAVSDELEEATLVITTKGKPHYQEGITPVAVRRDVKSYKRGKPEAVLVSMERPTKASSVKGGSKTSFVNDGYIQTCWVPEETDKSLWWQLDMENFYTVSEIRAIIPDDAQRDFTVEVSEDGINWKFAGKSIVGKELKIAIEPQAYGRFLRIIFVPSDKPINLSEIEVFGMAWKP